VRWVEIIIKAKREMEDAISNILYEVGSSGVVIEDSSLVLYERDWDYIDPKLLEIEDDIIIKGYLPEGIDFPEKIALIKDRLSLLSEIFGYNLKDIVITEVNEKEWENEWKKYYKPIRIGDRIVIKPTWEKYEKKDENEIIIELDPGMAFGTGTHETTVMCIKALEKYVKPGMSVFDIGCGSGILSIVSAKLGASKVIAVDRDEVAVGVAKENVNINEVEDRVFVNLGDLLKDIDDKADVIVANIIADVIIRLIDDMDKYMNSGSVAILSGIIKDREEGVKRKLEDRNFEIIETMEMGEWVAIIAKARL